MPTSGRRLSLSAAVSRVLNRRSADSSSTSTTPPPTPSIPAHFLADTEHPLPRRSLDIPSSRPGSVLVVPPVPPPSWTLVPMPKFLAPRTARALLGGALAISPEAVHALNALLRSLASTWVARACAASGTCPGPPLLPPHLEPAIIQVLGAQGLAGAVVRAARAAIAAAAAAAEDDGEEATPVPAMIPLHVTAAVMAEACPPAFAGESALPDVTVTYVNGALDAMAAALTEVFGRACRARGVTTATIDVLADALAGEVDGLGTAAAILDWSSLLDALVAHQQHQAAAAVRHSLDFAGAPPMPPPPPVSNSRESSLSLERKRSWRKRAQGGSLPPPASPRHAAGPPTPTPLDDFDELLKSKETKKLTLTPDRIRTMESGPGADALHSPGAALMSPAIAVSPYARTSFASSTIERQQYLQPPAPTGPTAASDVSTVGSDGGAAPAAEPDANDADPDPPTSAPASYPATPFSMTTEISVTAEEEALGLRPSSKPRRTHTKELADFFSTTPPPPLPTQLPPDDEAAGDGGKKKKKGGIFSALLRGSNDKDKDKSGKKVAEGRRASGPSALTTTPAAAARAESPVQTAFVFPPPLSSDPAAPRKYGTLPLNRSGTADSDSSAATAMLPGLFRSPLSPTGPADMLRRPGTAPLMNLRARTDSASSTSSVARQTGDEGRRAALRAESAPEHLGGSPSRLIEAMSATSSYRFPPISAAPAADPPGGGSSAASPVDGEPDEYIDNVDVVAMYAAGHHTAVVQQNRASVATPPPAKLVVAQRSESIRRPARKTSATDLSGAGAGVRGQSPTRPVPLRRSSDPTHAATAHLHRAARAAGETRGKLDSLVAKAFVRIRELQERVGERDAAVAAARAESDALRERLAHVGAVLGQVMPGLKGE
ncbi:hypothetical protein H9P43_000200 [Blastocladiella emersonii ATCC 22665]|nr:hypothetical protein H9P43_000200 [Blastocladiella emersonii ATCC 22665]